MPLNTKNLGETAERNAKNPRTRIHISLIFAYSGFDEALTGPLSLTPLTV